MDSWLQLALASSGSIVASVIASSGFWTYMQHKDETKAATARLMMGMAYDKITTTGLAYIERGWITKDEYEELHNFAYKPYSALGGNGVAERIMAEVGRLPIRSQSRYADILDRRQENEGWTNNVRVVSRRQQEASSE